MLTTTVCLKCGSTCETRCKAQTASKDFQEKRRALPRRRSRGRPSRRAPSASRRRQLLRYSRPRRRASGRPSSAPKGDQQNGYSEEFEHSKKKKGQLKVPPLCLARAIGGLGLYQKAISCNLARGLIVFFYPMSNSQRKSVKKRMPGCTWTLQQAIPEVMQLFTDAAVY